MSMENDLVIHIGRRIRARRAQLGMSQGQVGKGIGVASQQIQKYEKGTNVVNAVRLYDFSRVLRVPVSYFYEGMHETAKTGGVAEEASEFQGEYKATSDRETLEVLKSFKSIKDHAVRKRVADLLRTLSLKGI